jgi:hypothetical protein
MANIPSASFGDFENEIPLSFPNEETSLDSGLPSSPNGRCTMPEGSPPYGFLLHTIEALNNELCFHANTDIMMLAQIRRRRTSRMWYNLFELT